MPKHQKLHNLDIRPLTTTEGDTKQALIYSASQKSRSSRPEVNKLFPYSTEHEIYHAHTINVKMATIVGI